MAKNNLLNVPNALTCGNLICGCIATYFALGMGRMDCALLFICLGATFDFFDGFSARLLKISSPIGKELDSLADVVTFGVAPASCVFTRLQHCSSPTSFLPFVAFLIAAFSALRLAKFNLDTRQTTSFIGLPTPANALFWVSLMVWLENGGAYIACLGSETGQLATFISLLVLILISCYLLIAEIPMFALKFKNYSWTDNKIKYLFLMVCVLLLVLGLTVDTIFLPAIIVWYVILSVITQRRR